MGLDFSVSTALLASGLASSVLALALWYVSRFSQTPVAARWWAGGFVVNALRHFVGLCDPILGPALCRWLFESAQIGGTLLLVAGTLHYCRRGGRQRWAPPLIALGVVWAALFTLWGTPGLWLTVPLYTVSGLAMVYAGWLLLRGTWSFDVGGHAIVGVVLVLWGALDLGYPVLRPIAWVAPLWFLLAEASAVAVAVGLIVLVQRREHDLARQATERALASEARLQAGETRYRDLIDNSLQGIAIHRGENPLYANPAFLRIFGFKTWEELGEVDVLDALVDPEELPRVRGIVADRLAGRPAPEQYEFRGRRRDGTPLWLSNTARLITWQGEQAIQSTMIDVTEQKRIEEELRAHQRLLRTVIDSLPHIVIVRDRNGRMLMANKAWMDAFRADPADYLYKTTAEMGVHPAAEARLVHERSLEVVASERIVQHEHDMTLSTGRRRFFTIRVPLRGEHGRAVGVVSISLDITEQKATEEQLRQAQKMEAVGQLTGGVAHDFNNLLGVILGNLELLQARIGSDGRSAAYIQRAMRATERGAGLTQRLLAFSRRQTLQPRSVNLSLQVGELLDLLRSSLGETIRIEADCDPAAGQVYVDPNQLENTLLNLALNARDAMPAGGTLRIEVATAAPGDVPEETEGVATGPRWIVLTVRDTGMGMPPDVLERAVEPFFTTKGPGSGSGLGLSMIYGFMNQSGGRMRIESREGAGTAVSLYFRRSDAPAEVLAHAATEAPPMGTAETVLVVEDDPALGNLAMEMLAELNYTAIKAADGHEALQALRDHPQIGLLFTDVVLPNGMDGVVLAEEARRLRPDLKVLFTSGYAETVFERHPGDIAHAELMQKPYRLGDLATKLRVVLGSGPGSAT